MEFISGCRTFKDAIGDEKISHDTRVKAINGVYSKLKQFSYIVINHSIYPLNYSSLTSLKCSINICS